MELTDEQYIEELAQRIIDAMTDDPELCWSAVLEGRTGLNDMNCHELMELGELYGMTDTIEGCE